MKKGILRLLIAFITTLNNTTNEQIEITVVQASAVDSTNISDTDDVFFFIVIFSDLILIKNLQTKAIIIDKNI